MDDHLLDRVRAVIAEKHVGRLWKEVRELRELTVWRECSQEKPGDGEQVLISTEFGDISTHWFYAEDGWAPNYGKVGCPKWWRSIGPSPLLNMPVFLKESVAMYECKCGATKNTNEPCLNCGPLPGEGGE